MSIIYTCVKCDRDMTNKDLELRGDHIKCIHCGYRVIRKKRNPIVRRVKAI